MPSEALQGKIWTAQESTVSWEYLHIHTHWYVRWLWSQAGMVHLLGLYFTVHHRKRCPTYIIRIRMLEVQYEAICHGRLLNNGCTHFSLCIHTPSRSDFWARPIRAMVPLPSNLCLLYHLFQPNRIQQNQCHKHATHRPGIDLVLLIFIYFYYGVKMKTPGRYASTGLQAFTHLCQTLECSQHCKMSQVIFW